MTQKKLMGVTPDIRFLEPTFICGHHCWWLEFKDFFGFQANPYVAAHNRKQFSKYAAQIGPGAVVYELGFETDHVDIEGVKIFRKEEVIKSLTSQGRGGKGASGTSGAEASKSTVDTCVEETSLSRLGRKGQGRINEEHLSREKTRRRKNRRNRPQHAANAASMAARTSKVVKSYRIKAKHKTGAKSKV